MAALIKKTDAQIQRNVLDELHWDTRVGETDVAVEVNAGAVTLTGNVDTWAARVAAQEAAHRVPGVVRVENDIRVKLSEPHERTDAEIAQAVRRALEWDVLVPEGQIGTTVSQGVVTLEGKVDHWSQHDDAARAIRNLAGVRDVKNLISVHPPNVSLQTLRATIDCALERLAERAAEQVQIAVDGSTVTLEGTVPTWLERKTVEEAVRGTVGVKNIVNHLSIAADPRAGNGASTDPAA